MIPPKKPNNPPLSPQCPLWNQLDIASISPSNSFVSRRRLRSGDSAPGPSLVTSGNASSSLSDKTSSTSLIMMVCASSCACSLYRSLTSGMG